ncbi:MAG: hypothetical protein QNJ49_02605 [Mastigocoleus sp. MO_167.B18]|nr:hypothetical protein [Mastigocoleus sp. MO_188.B34]MDJ0772307.1 hypothetical protein [Mastigocoleus sp. MO_167.B18]
MDFNRLDYIKNVSADHGWAYSDCPIALWAYFQLNFKRGEDKDKKSIDDHALHLPKGSLIILSQRLPESERYLTHVVELVNEGNEDKEQWTPGMWGVFRWVKVHWIANFQKPSSIPRDEDEMKVNWGWYDTKAKRLDSPNLMSEWENIEKLRLHLKKVFSQHRSS